MKMLLLIPVLLILMLGCGLIESTDTTEAFIPGTYIRFSSHDFGKEYDTLVITLQNEAAHEYKILRKWKYERVLDGKVMAPDYQRLTTTAIYHSSDKVMQDTESGSLYSFDLKEKELFNGQIKYKNYETVEGNCYGGDDGSCCSRCANPTSTRARPGDGSY